MEGTITSLKRTARLAGILYLFLAIVASYSYMYVSAKIILQNNAAATANNILKNEFLFRTGLAANVIGHALFVWLVLVLYRLFKQVNVFYSKLMVGLVIASISIAFSGDVLQMTALGIFKENLLSSFQPHQSQNLAMIFIRIAKYCTQMVSLFWGLWLIPLGLLVYKSGYIPRLLGALLIINGIAYVVNCFTFVLFPGFFPIVSKVIFPVYFIGELPLMFWLLIVGVKDHLSITIISETETKWKPAIDRLKEQIP